MKLNKAYKPVPILSDGDLNAGATLDCDSINMKNGHHCTFLVNLQTLGVADSVLKVFSGATAAAKTSALTFNYAFGGAAQGSASADIFATEATSAALSLTNATYDNHGLIVEVDASDMDLANGEFWLTMEFSDPATGSTGNVSVWALVAPRYSADNADTMLA